MIVDGLKAEGKDPKTAKVVYVGGDPTDGNAKQFHDGADKVLKAAGIKPAFETPGAWDQQKSQTSFEQAYTALKGKVDAVWAANDINAGCVIQVLDKNGMTVPVSGQDASPIGLQNILLGKQYGTVYKPFQLEADGAVDLAQQLMAGKKPTVDKKDTDGRAVHRRDAGRRDDEEHAAGVRRRQRQGLRRVHRRRQGRLHGGRHQRLSAAGGGRGTRADDGHARMRSRAGHLDSRRGGGGGTMP